LRIFEKCTKFVHFNALDDQSHVLSFYVCKVSLTNRILTSSTQLDSSFQPVFIVHDTQYGTRENFSHTYNVSQKTSHLWLAITLPHVNRFWYVLAEMLRTK